MTLIESVRRCQVQLRAAAQTLALKAVKSNFQDDTDDYTSDPRYAVDVSRFGGAKPPLKRDTKTVEVVVDSRVHRASKVKDQIDKLYESGTIDDEAYSAARLFETEFAKCGYSYCRTVNLEGARGGQMGIEDIISRSMTSRDYVSNTFKLLGGPDTVASVVVAYYVGLGHDIKAIATKEGKSRDYWTGILHSALQTMAADYREMMRGKARRSTITGIPAEGLRVPR